MGEIPENCNSLTRIDETKEFCAINCKWCFKTPGPKAVKKTASKKQSKKSKFIEATSLTFLIEKDLLEFIKKQALMQSVNCGEIIHHNELIRIALQKAFPTPKQYDMFGESKNPK